MRLGENDLSGPIPSQLGAMTGLSILDLKRNQLTGSIPPALGNMASLTYIDVGENLLTREIPAVLAGITNLYHLGFHANGLTGLTTLTPAQAAPFIDQGNSLIAIWTEALP